MAMVSLVNFYYKLVVHGDITIDEVPEKYRDAVRKLIESDN